MAACTQMGDGEAMPSLRWAPHRAASDPCPKKPEEARRGLWSLCAQEGSKFCFHPKARVHLPSYSSLGRTTLSPFLPHTVPDTSGLSPPFARRRKIGQQPFRAGSQTTYLVFLIIWLCGPAWLHTDASSFWVRLAASNALMALAASPCALPPLSYMVSDAHRSPVSILFLSGLLAGCSADVHPCGAT